ncbi:hypothetical protein CEUSTIGMA_g6237.t1 [Chlamydomonas eustigma]|uniref:JmjC domain-containing protein n=1 Tax=Chlamydomonas eustigma TaxID=1157962 RepID=A0A250X7R2_9CHLO|nr:hypothetical protein CEUSTIGMA_g6237.t1 [Chlamydomonas eustigma]|eukprot:GAX78800.1 hypothetical protein CEUSTIGMA_g6237.t1 [Chlamydomonas eustigma]
MESMRHSSQSLLYDVLMKDQAASAQYQNSCSWIHEIEDAPTYYPSKEEWDRPLEFIQGLHLKASAFGICKIVPPVMASASGAMVLGPTSFKFTAQFQEVKSAEWQSWEDVKFVHDPQNYSISKFEAQANEFMRKKFGATGLLPPRMIELEYWRAREMSCKGKHDWVTYGNDVEGSAFSASPLDPIGSSKWNLKVLPKESQSILRHISKIVPGVTDPFLYIGMLYATFAWHVEDHYLYSINYHHQGAPKTWYGVPSSHADLFEDAAARVVFHQAVSSHHSKGCEGGKDAQERVQEALQGKTAMFPPKLLLKEGVRVVRAVQQAGEFVVTFPRAYHAGFSHGFNIGEAVNFGTNDWFPFGQACHQRYTRLKKLPLLEHERLLCCEAISICQKLCPLVEDGAQRPHSHSSSERTVHQAAQTAKITVASKGLAGNSKGGTAGHDCSLISEVAATSCIPTTQMMDLGVISKDISEEVINATHVDPQSYQRLGSGLRDLSRLEALVMEEKQRCSSFSSSFSCTFTGVDAAASAARNPDLTTLRMFLSTVRAQFSDCHVLQRAGGGMVHPMPALSEGILCFCCNTACYMGYGIMEMQQDNEAGAGEEDEEEAEDNCTTVPYCLKCCMQTLQLQQFEREDQPETDRRSAVDYDEAAAEGLVLYWNKEAAQYKHWCMVIEPLLYGHRNPLPDLLEAREVPGGSAAAVVAGISLCISPDRKRRQGCYSSPLKSALCSSPYKKGRMWMGSCHDPASDPSCFDCEHVPGIIIQQIAKNTGMQRQHGGGDKLFAKAAAVAVEESSSTAPQSPSGGLLSKSRASLLIPRLSPMENGRENVPSEIQDTCVDTEALGQTAVSLQKRLNAGLEFPNRCGVVDAPGCGMKEGCHCPVFLCSDDRNNNQDCRSCLGSTDPRSTGWTSFNELLQASNKKQGRPFSIPHYQPLHDNHDCMIQHQNHIMLHRQATQDAPMLTSQDMSWLNNYLQCRQELRNSSSSHAQELLSAATTVHLSSLNAPINEVQQGQNPVHLTNWRPDSNVTPGKQHAKAASRVPVPSSSCLLEGSGTFVGSVEKKGQSNANLLYKKLTSSGISMADLHRMRREVKRQGFTTEQFLRAFQGVMHILEASGVASEGLLTTDRILNYLATCGRLKPHGLIGVSPGAWSQFQVEALAKNESSFVPLPKSSETLPRFRVEGCPEKGCETLQEAVQSPSAREWIGVHRTFDKVEAHLCGVPSKRPASQQQQQWGYDTQLDLQTNMTQERMLPGQTVGSLASRKCEFPAPLIPVTPASEQLKQPPVPEVGNRNQHCSLRELQQQQRILKMVSFAEQSRERKWDFTRGACRDETAAKDDGIPNLDCDQRHQQQQAALTPPSCQVSEFSKSFFRKVLSIATEAVPTCKKGAAVKSPPQSGRKQKLGECWRLAQGRQLSYPQHHQLQGRCLPPPRLNGAGSSRTAVDVWSTGSGLDALGIMKVTSAPVQLKKQSCPTVMQQQHPHLHQGEWMVSNAAASMDISIRARLPPGFDTKVVPSSCHSKEASLHRHALDRSGLWQISTGLQQGPRDDQEKLVKRKLSSSCSIRTQYSHNKQDWDMFLRKLQRDWPDMAAEVESLEHDQIWNMQALGPQFLEQVFGGSRDHAVEFTRVVLGGDVGHPLMRPIWKRVFPVPN